MENKNNNINLDDYLDKLVGKIFKILPLLEENPTNAKKYLNSLTIELDGMTQCYSDDSYIISTLFSLQGIKTVTDYNVCRKTVFDCLNNINNLKSKLKKKEEN
jgi:hypothetical protein